MVSLAVKYRPTEWEEVTEQKSIVTILNKQLESGNIKNSLLFAGASGCGKTTAARLYAKKLGSIPIEIDAASNNGVDNVRNIITEAQERSLSSKYKIFIFDEAHMLSNSAWNAMLKAIEEPSPYTIFIFCTTDPQKIPPTILNRVQRYNFTSISSKGIFNRLKFVSDKECIEYSDEALDYISKIADGSMREALSLLDQALDFNPIINLENVIQALGNYSYDYFFNLVNASLDGDEKVVLSILDNYAKEGRDLKLFVDQYMSFCLDLIKYSIFKNHDCIKTPQSFSNDLNLAINFDQPEKYYGYVVNKLLELKNMIKYDTNIKNSVEVTMLQIARCQ